MNDNKKIRFLFLINQLTVVFILLFLFLIAVFFPPAMLIHFSSKFGEQILHISKTEEAMEASRFFLERLKNSQMTIVAFWRLLTLLFFIILIVLLVNIILLKKIRYADKRNEDK